MIDAKRIEEMKRLTAEATEGKWTIAGRPPCIVDKPLGDDKKVIVYGMDGNREGQRDNWGDLTFIAKSRQFVPDIIAAYEEQIRRVDAHSTVIKGLSEMLEERDTEIAKLREALEFYADRANYGVYTDASNNCPTTNTLMDNGYIAKEALTHD